MCAVDAAGHVGSSQLRPRAAWRVALAGNCSEVETGLLVLRLNIHASFWIAGWHPEPICVSPSKPSARTDVCASAFDG